MSNFTVIEHTSPCQYVREYWHGARSDDATLHLAVKEYRPKEPVAESEDAITIISSHGNGFPKECYEALWDELLNASHGFRIRSIWIADIANQGQSYVKNKDRLGDDPGWLDHSRDLLLMINTFRDRMKAPIVGIGHSMGCSHLAGLSVMHPRLLHSLVLIEPVLQDFAPPGPNAAMFSSMRRETWDSRAKAEAQMSKNGFFKAMDPRALKAYLKNALTDTEDGGVILTTPKAQEAWTYVRPIFEPLPDERDRETLEASRRERLLNPHVTPFSRLSEPVFTLPEMGALIASLPHIRPRTLFMYGEYSHIASEETREFHSSVVGTGHGGNGGKDDGGVEVLEVVEASHLCPFEKPQAIAVDVSNWLGKEMTRWKVERDFWVKRDTGKSKNNRTELSEKWLKEVKKPADLMRPVKKAAKL
ncbi:Alpha/beta hydrolase family-domain-containing protein [Lophiotrema nucula]|uniref:Alpha/beta hydrolase family-domain-containing protein n=1 Tax=Lophiotrema nucula TaxID=690887 RepID=A0A6A5YNW7_9PLEO|nr:Alpha/beta hydrolase family-domain-containing protein [Lophiotrema nucula]